MRILIIADPWLPIPVKEYGGVERVVEYLVREYVQRGLVVDLASNGNSSVPCNRHISLGSGAPSKYQRVCLGCMLMITTAINKYDIVHSFGHIDYLLPFMPFAFTKIHSFGALPTQSSLTNRLRLVPHRNLYFTTCGQHMLKALQTAIPTTAIHNGVILERFSFQPKTDDNAHLIFLGRLEHIKGVHHAIEVSRVTGRKLVIAGNISPNKSSEAYFEQEIKPHLSDRVQYIGPVDDEKKNLLLGSSAALLMPVEWDEPFGIVMVEALACGTPVIGLNRGAVPEVVNSGITGQVCQNVDDMVAAVHRIPSFNRGMCRAEAETRFSSSVIANQYLALYNKILQNRGIGH